MADFSLASLAPRIPIDPAKAAENINNAEKLRVTPEQYADSKVFQEETQIQDLPQTAPRAVHKRMAQSEQFGHVVRPDLEDLNWFEKQLKFMKESLRGTDINREKNDLNYTRAWGTELTKPQMNRLFELEDAEKTVVSGEELDLSFPEQIPGLLAGVTSNIVQAAWEGKEFALTAGLVGAGIGTVAGAFGGPGGMAFGAKGGFVTGTTLATTFGSIPFDTFVQSTGEIFGELDKSTLADDPEGLATRQALAFGGGALMTAVELVPIFKLAKKVPFLKKIISPKAFSKEILKPVNGKWLQLVKDLGSAAAIEGSEEGAQEIIKLMAVNLGGWDGEEKSFFEAVSKTASQWRQIVKNAAVGAVAGPGFVAAGRVASPAIEAVGRATDKAISLARPLPAPEPEPVVSTEFFNPDLPSDLTGIEKNLSPDQQGMRALSLADKFEQISEHMKETQISELLPDAALDIRQEMFDEAGFSYVFLEKSELNEWSEGDPEKIADIQKLIGVDQKSDSDLNAPIRVASAKVSQLVDKYPKSLSQLVKFEPESPTANQYVKRVESIRKGDPFVTQEDAFNEAPYLNPEIVEELGEGEGLREAVQDVQEAEAEIVEAKTKVTETVNDNPDTNEVVPLEQKIAEVQAELTREAIFENEESIGTVDDYIDNTKLVGKLTDHQQDRVNKGLPAYSINLNSLSIELRNNYADDVVLKKRHVFDRKGSPAGAVATRFGFNDVDQFLVVLANSPSSEQQAKNIAKEEKAKITGEAKIVTSYRGVTDAHLHVMGKVRDKAVEAGEEVTEKVPSRSRLEGTAVNTVGKSKIKDLNANKNKIGERRSEALAIIARAKGDINEFMIQKRKAAQNSELARMTHKRILQVNEAFAVMAKLGTPEMQALLKEAHPTFVNAINTLSNFYGLGPVSDIEAGVEEYNKFAERMHRQGRGDFSMDKETFAGMQPQESINDMTVDQILELNKLIGWILKEASLENELIGKEFGVENDITEEKAHEIREYLIQNREFDPDKAVVPFGNVSNWARIKSGMGDVDAILHNMQFILLRLDSGVFNGLLAKTFYQPMIAGYSAKIKEQGVRLKQWQEGIAKYDANSKVKFMDLGVTKVSIPEWSNNKALNKGNLTRVDLLMMQAHMGNDENIESLKNYKITKEQFRTILERELTKADFDFVQETMWDHTEELKPRIDAMEKADGKPDLEFIIGQEFEAFGKTYRGGYLPLRYLKDGLYTVLKEEVKIKLGKAKPRPPIPSNAYLGIVRSPHTKERTGPDYLLDLSMNTYSMSIEDIIHDLHMRTPVRNNMTLIDNEVVTGTIKGVIGTPAFDVLVGSIMEQTKSATVANTRLYEGMQRSAAKVIGKVQSGFTLAMLPFNLSTILKSTLALPQIRNQMGEGGGIYLTRAALELYTPYGEPRAEVKALIAEIDPSLNNFRLGLDEHSATTIANYTPQKRMFNNQKYNYFRTMQERTIDLALSKVLGGIDAQFKSIVGRAAYLKFVEGKAEGFPPEVIFKMTPEELDENAKAFAEQLSASATMRAEDLSKAAIQKNLLGKMVTMFWNEPRNWQSSRRQDLRNLGKRGDEMVAAFREGDVAKANAILYGVTGDIGRVLMMSMLTLVIINWSLGMDMFPDEEEGDQELDLLEDIAGAPNWVLQRFTTARGRVELAGALFASTLPVVGTLLFAAQAGRAVSIPVTKVGQDLVDVASDAIPAFYETIVDDLDFIEAWNSLRSNEKQAFFNILTYGGAKLPVSGPAKAFRWFEDNDIDVIDAVGGMTEGAFLKVVDLFIERNDEENLTSAQKFELISRERIEEGGKSTMQQTVDQLKDMVAQIRGPGHALKTQDYDIIKQVESNGNWRARPLKDGKALSSAFGLYQFTKDTWETVKNSPEGKREGLTTKGRVASNGKQQEKAMRILTKKNEKFLLQHKVPVSIDSLYMAHHFGAEASKFVYTKSDKTSVSSILTAEVKKANPALVKRNVKTVADMKKYIKNQLNRGRSELGLREE